MDALKLNDVVTALVEADTDYEVLNILEIVGRSHYQEQPSINEVTEEFITGEDPRPIRTINQCINGRWVERDLDNLLNSEPFFGLEQHNNKEK